MENSIVCKFGGTSVANSEQIRRVENIVMAVFHVYWQSARHFCKTLFLHDKDGFTVLINESWQHCMTGIR